MLDHLGFQLPEHLFYVRYLAGKLMFITISSSTLLALNASMLLLVSFILQGIRPDFLLLSAMFTLVFSVYNVDKLTSPREDVFNDPAKSDFFRHRRGLWTGLIICSFTVTFAFTALKGLPATIIVCIPVIAGLLYSVKLPFMSRLKTILGVKNLLTATVFASVITLLPLSTGSLDYLPFIFLFYFIFIKFFINTILFDVRDLKGDKAAGIRTLPAVLGEKGILKLITLLNISLIIWLGSFWLLGYLSNYLWALIFSIAYGFLYIKLFYTKKPLSR